MGLLDCVLGLVMGDGKQQRAGAAAGGLGDSGDLVGILGGLTQRR